MGSGWCCSYTTACIVSQGLLSGVQTSGAGGPCMRRVTMVVMCASPVQFAALLLYSLHSCFIRWMAANTTYLSSVVPQDVLGQSKPIMPVEQEQLCSKHTL